MPSLGLGSTMHRLTTGTVDAIVAQRIGVYALGKPDGATFTVNYVGRSDYDLNARLKSWVGSRYTHFKFGYCTTKRAAFEKECTMYHDFGGSASLDNEVHPARPADVDCSCPLARCAA